MRVYVSFLIFLLLFLGINIALLDNLRKIWHVGYPIILLVINLDLLILVIVFAIFFRKFIKIYIEGSKRRIRKKISQALFIYLFLPILFLNFATSFILLQSTKTFVSSQLKDLAKKSESLYKELSTKEEEKIWLYREFFKFLTTKGEDPRAYLSGLKEVERIDILKDCREDITPDVIVMCVDKYKIVLKRDRETLSKINSIYELSQELRRLVKARDVLSGIYLYFLVLITFITLLASVWFGNLIARYISLPLEMLSQRVKRVAKGNLSEPIPIPQTGDEIQELSESFENMRKELKSIYEKLESDKKMLENLINTLPVGVAYIHKDGTTLINQRFKEMFGEVKELEKVSPPPHIRKVSLESPEGKIHIYEDLTPVILSERFKTWQYAVKRIAHEIKNPLTPISLNLERVLRLIEKEPMDKERVKESIRIVLEEIFRLKELVNKFRDLSAEREPKFQKLSLGELLKKLSKLYSGIELVVEGDKEVYGDRDMLKDMFLNLLNNSIEWGAKKVKIKISEEFLDYKDDGKGIERGKEEVIFLPYHSESPTGMGLGLAIVKHIAQVHGWSIKALPEEKGFHLVLEFNPM